MSTALSLYSPQEQVALAADVWPLANRLASTEFVPKALRDRPESVMACMIKGAELGIPLMQSLSSIHVIEGKPTMSAELMRAVVLSRGHEIEIVESSAARCVARGKRDGREQWQTFTRTIEDAKAANLLGKQVWRQYPADMLLARVTGALCRAVFADCLAGISYTREELEDGEETVLVDSIESGASSPAPRTARARAAATRGAKPAPAAEPPIEPPKARGEVPLLPGEEPGDDDDIVDAELVDDAPVDLFPPIVDDDGRVDDPGDESSGSRLSGPARIAIMMGEHGVTDRESKLRAVESIVERPISSTNDLEVFEQTMVVEFLAALDDGAPFPWPTPDVAADVAPRGAEADGWSGDQWRQALGRWGTAMSMSKLLKQAKVFAEGAGSTVPTKLDTICDSGVGGLLLGWAEDQVLGAST